MIAGVGRYSPIHQAEQRTVPDFCWKIRESNPAISPAFAALWIKSILLRQSI
jgi:hypothetical protein